MGRGGPAEPRSAAAGAGAGRAARDRRPRRARGVRLPRGRGARRRADRGLPARGRRPGGRARRVERARRGRAGGLARARARSCSRAPGACIPPVAVDRTVCVVGSGDARAVRRVPAAAGRPRAGAPRAPPAPAGALPLRAAPRAGRAAAGGRTGGALHHGRGALRGRGAAWCPPPTSRAGARSPRTSTGPPRSGCDVYLTELKAAAIDTVARRARDEGARVVFVRNRPVGVDEALLEVWGGA